MKAPKIISFDNYFKTLASEFSKCGCEQDFAEATEPQKLLFLYAFYHYFDADRSKIPDIISGCIYRETVDDHIAGVFIDSESDNEDVDILLVLYSENPEETLPAYYRFLDDAKNAYFCAIKKKSTRKELDFLGDDEAYKIEKGKRLNVCLLTNFSPKKAKQDEIRNNVRKLRKGAEEDVTFKVIFGYEIESEILEIEDPKGCVSTGVIQIDSARNCLFFGQEKSVIVNLSALSLKSLYNEFATRGLFAQNLRYYVKNAKTDNKIINTIKKEPGNFWYFNNGIIILCKDYYIDENSVLLEDFSIINGGQSTVLIGITDFTEDFYVQCKIIKNAREGNAQVEFLSAVAEATNTQKPIKPKDLIANKVEQRKLKTQLAENGIFCQIKRGERINKTVYPEPWQNTSNDEIGQFLLSFVYQLPGTARSSKASIFNAPNYNMLFGKTYNSQFLGDLLKLKTFYKKWDQKLQKNREETDKFKIGLVKNGMHFMSAIIGAMYRTYKRPEILAELQTCEEREEKWKILSRYEMDHPVFIQTDCWEELLFNLFDLCYRKIYREVYELDFERNEKYAVYSNFTKTNTKYQLYVPKVIELFWRKEVDERDRAIMADIFYVPTQEERVRDLACLEQCKAEEIKKRKATPKVVESTPELLLL